MVEPIDTACLIASRVREMMPDLCKKKPNVAKEIDPFHVDCDHIHLMHFEHIPHRNTSRWFGHWQRSCLCGKPAIVRWIVLCHDRYRHPHVYTAYEHARSLREAHKRAVELNKAYEATEKPLSVPYIKPQLPLGTPIIISDDPRDIIISGLIYKQQSFDDEPVYFRVIDVPAHGYIRAEIIVADGAGRFLPGEHEIFASYEVNDKPVSSKELMQVILCERTKVRKEIERVNRLGFIMNDILSAGVS